MDTSLDLEFLLLWLQDHGIDLGILSGTRRHNVETLTSDTSSSICSMELFAMFSLVLRG